MQLGGVSGGGGVYADTLTSCKSPATKAPTRVLDQTEEACDRHQHANMIFFFIIIIIISFLSMCSAIHVLEEIHN